MGKLAVAIVKRQRDRAGCPGMGSPISARVYSNPLGRSIRTRCSSPVTGLRMGSHAYPPDHPLYMPHPGIHINRHINGPEDGVEHLIQGCREHVPYGRTRVGFAPAENGEQAWRWSSSARSSRIMKALPPPA